MKIINEQFELRNAKFKRKEILIIILLDSPNIMDNLKWRTRDKFCVVRHCSELTQRFPASNGGAVFSISICDAALQLVTGCDSDSRSSKNYVIFQKTTSREQFLVQTILHINTI